VPLGRCGESSLFALRFGSYQIILSDDIAPRAASLQSQHRERVDTIAPFLAFDRDPYLVLARDAVLAGRCLHDEHRYPYSTPAGRINYIRNSVKFVDRRLQRHDDGLSLRRNDPIAATFRGSFPTLFKPLREMPRDLASTSAIRGHLRDSGAGLFDVSHDAAGRVLQPRGPVESPDVDERRDRMAMQPYYTIMRLPGEKDAEFIQMLPVHAAAPRQPGAWLVARSDGEHYGDWRLRVPEAESWSSVRGRSWRASRRIR
jgi:uncharacterized membrane protein (UPF0182 family)